MATRTRTDMVVDRSAHGELLRINFNISFPQAGAAPVPGCLMHSPAGHGGVPPLHSAGGRGLGPQHCRGRQCCSHQNLT